MISAFIKNKNFSIAAPHCNLKIKWIIKNIIINMLGRSAGYNVSESRIFPLSISMNDLCIPHPGHSIPSNDLYMHG